MALIFKYEGDYGNNFELLTNGLQGHNSFDITEIRGVDPTEITLGVNVFPAETTRYAIEQVAVNGGFKLVEYDGQELVETTFDPPRIASMVPEQEAIDVAVDSTIAITFTENVAKATEAGPVIKLIDITNNTVIETFAYDSLAVVIVDNVATITPTLSFDNSIEVGVLIDKGYFTDTDPEDNHGGIYDVQYYNFTTVSA